MENEKKKISIWRPRLLCSTKRDVICALIFGFVTSFFFFFGLFLSKYVKINVTQLLLSLGCAVVPTFILGEAYLRIRNGLTSDLKKREIVFSKKDGLRFLIVLLIFLVCWLPVFLAYYPGLFCYDVIYQLPQSAGSYTAHHPLVHTLLLQFFYYIVGQNLLHNVTTGIAIFTIFQLVVLASALSYQQLFLYRMGCNKVIRIIILAFTALFPVIAMLAISLTKDIFFTAFFITGLVCFCYWELAPDFFKRKLKVLFVICLVGCIIFRNNALYSIIVTLIIGLIFMKGRRKQLAIYMGIGIICGLAINLGLQKFLNAKSSPGNETLSVPYQQMAYVYNVEYDNLTDEEKTELEKFMKTLDQFTPYCADIIKAHGYAKDDLKGYISLYVKLFLKYPGDYIQEFFNNTMGYWYISDTSVGEIYGSGLEGRGGYLLSDNHGFDVVHTSYFPWLENLYEHLYSANEYEKVPVLFTLSNMGLYFWILIMGMFYAINNKNKKALIPMAFVIVYLLTLLLGPCALPRYGLPWILSIPALFVVTLKDEK